MNFEFNLLPVNMPALLMASIGWILLFAGILIIYKKQDAPPKFWKVLVAGIIGLFCFTFNYQTENTMLRIPVLPLGVWILMWILKRRGTGWSTYRPYAWTGFVINFVFLLTIFLTPTVHNWFYPAHEPSTYIAEVKGAEIIATHPSANERRLDAERLMEQLDTMKTSQIHSEQWYRDTYDTVGTEKVDERFPYMVEGIDTRWGSGINPLIYVENDGKGLLIRTGEGQIYFRSEQTFLKEGA
ncbi:hypothetical protein [Thalassobacillus hwangdonensis]|uniref:Uncharacterized protein n=1 Tax=Thalassobacillus hwangdonensis TaxID=546108 RepID=A0ABW3L383_9BACI